MEGIRRVGSSVAVAVVVVAAASVVWILLLLLLLFGFLTALFRIVFQPKVCDASLFSGTMTSNRSSKRFHTWT